MHLRQVVKLLAAVLVFAFSLSSLYLYAQGHVGGSWQPIACVNGALAIFIFLVSSQKKVFGWTDLKLRYFYPSLAIVLGVVLLSLLSRMVGGATTVKSHPEIWAFIVLIPLVEEIVFRVGFGQFFRKYAGNVWGAYFSALLFALVHTLPTPEKLLTLQIGLPLGPFLLGLCAEWIYIKSSRLLPIYAFHAVCNATVFIFQHIDARWLDWLGLFYI